MTKSATTSRRTTPIRRTPRTTKVIRDITNQAELDCGYTLAVLVEVEAGDRTISGMLDGEVVITCCPSETICESYLHNLACDRIAADAHERDLAVEAVEYQIAAFVAEVEAAQPTTETATIENLYEVKQSEHCWQVVYRGWVIGEYGSEAAARQAITDDINESSKGLFDIRHPAPRVRKPWPELPWATDPSTWPAEDEAEPTPAPILPPFIYMSPDGLTWAGAPACYTNWIDADIARSEWMATA